MKECSGKKVLKVKVAQNDPLDSFSQKNLPDGQWDQECGVVLHIQKEVYLKDSPRVAVIVSEDSLHNQDADQECRELHDN